MKQEVAPSLPHPHLRHGKGHESDTILALLVTYGLSVSITLVDAPTSVLIVGSREYHGLHAIRRYAERSYSKKRVH